MNNIPKVIIPGYGGSGEGHWQTHWESGSVEYDRIAPKSFDNPDLNDWLISLEEAIARQSIAPILVAHSLGCLLVAEYLNRSKGDVAGVFMVAVPDPDGPNFPIDQAPDFAKVSRNFLPCPSLIIASDNDPYNEASYTSKIALSWGAEVVNIGNKDHISDVGQWDQGRNLLTAFSAGVQQRC